MFADLLEVLDFRFWCIFASLILVSIPVVETDRLRGLELFNWKKWKNSKEIRRSPTVLSIRKLKSSADLRKHCYYNRIKRNCINKPSPKCIDLDTIINSCEIRKEISRQQWEERHSTNIHHTCEPWLHFVLAHVYYDDIRISSLEDN